MPFKISVVLPSSYFKSSASFIVLQIRDPLPLKKTCARCCVSQRGKGKMTVFVLVYRISLFGSAVGSRGRFSSFNFRMRSDDVLCAPASCRRSCSHDIIRLTLLWIRSFTSESYFHIVYSRKICYRVLRSKSFAREIIC